MWATKWTEKMVGYGDSYEVTFPTHGFTATRHDIYTLSSEHVASREWVQGQIANIPIDEISAEIDLKRDCQDLGVYSDPVEQTSSTTFTASWGDASNPEEPRGEGLKLEWTGGEGKQWAWSNGDRSLYVDLSPDGQWSISYNNFEDPGGYLHDGRFNDAQLEAPTWTNRV